MTDKPLSPRHQRFVAEYLRDGNATQAYIRAGFSARGAQSCASRLLGQPHIDAALAAGRQRIAEALEVTVERVAQEYARIAFAPIEVGLDHGKALQATRLKLQALAALTRHIELFTEQPQPGLTPEDRERYEATIAQHERNWQHALEDRRTLARERDKAQIALASAQAKLAAAERAAAATAEPKPLQSMASREPHAAPAQQPQPLQSMATPQPRDVPANPPVEPLEDLIRRHRQSPGSLTSAEALRLIKPGAFLGW